MKRESIAEEIIRYLESHPGAADSLEGITSWWLLDDPRKSVKTVARAIQRLTSEGVLVCASNTHLLLQWISIKSESRSGAQRAGAAFQTWRIPSRVQKRTTRGNGCKSILINLTALRNCRKLKLNRSASAFP